ncbi:MAG: hypothetical protein HN350_07965 [Phycisphaerales bacterium]|nr:hypothetical protein [Phycisphaerales bacterium]
MRDTFIVSAMMLVCMSAGELHAADGKSPEQELKVRVLVWAKPGQSASALTAENWTEFASPEDYAAGKGGKPAVKAPDAKSDLILPDAPDGETYVAGCMVSAKTRRRNRSSKPMGLSCRHVTIGAGAGLDGGIGVSRGKVRTSDYPDDDTPMDIYGNVTVKDAGCIYGPLRFVGDKHSQFTIGKSPEPLGRSLLTRKTKGAGVTIQAPQYDLVGGVTVESGKLIMASGTHIRTNATLQARIDLKKLRKRGYGRGEPYVWVHDKAVLEMHAGSRIGRVNPPEDIVADLRIEGLLQVGRRGDENQAPAIIELTPAAGDGGFLTQPGGLYILPTAEVQNFGRLSITAGSPDPKAPEKGVSIFLEKAVDFGKVSIDYLRPGGVAASDPAAAAKALSGATFGKNCKASGDAIYSKIKQVDFKGGWGSVEFVDGLSTECEILFPLGDRLIVRSRGNRIAQSFDLKSVCAIEIDGKRTEYNPKGALSASSQQARKFNALWADVPGKGQIGAYGKQKWPKAPLMVWRRPGQTGSRFVAANWLDETGRPYFDVPTSVDSETLDLPVADILLPASETPYQVVEQRPQWRIRHMTLEHGAQFFLTYNVTGNLWMKDGSGMHAPWFGKYSNKTPGLHRFLRFDGMRLRAPQRGEKAPQRIAPEDWRISQWGCYHTAPGGTLEIIGKNHVNDQFRVIGEGKLIMSEGSYLSPGLRACFAIQPEATVVLLQDARISVETTAKQLGKASVWVGGTLMIGTPERPITRDMLFPVVGVEEQYISRQPAGGIRTPGVSFLLGQEGRLLMNTVDPTKARLVFKMHDSDKAKAAGKKYGNPKGSVLAFFGKAELNGVVFDNVLEGGIMVTPKQRATWKNVFYGKGNLGEPEKLYWDIKTENE